MVARGVFLLFSLLLAAPSLAQSGDPSGLMAAMRDAYERLDYDTAERRAREALTAYDAFSADQLVEVHTTLGLILHARNEPLEARAQFAAALSLDPSLELDPLLVSPKTMDFFEEIKADGRSTERIDQAPTIRYVRVRDLRPAATLRSLAVPGWGQLYKGDRTKGWALISIWSATVAGTVAAHLLRSNARQAYLDATNPDEIAGQFDTFVAWHRTRSAFALGAATVWGVAALDALILGGPAQRAVIAGPGIGAGWGVRIQF